nr:hypothetical protein [Micromonospora sp. DSM 115978]
MSAPPEVVYNTATDPDRVEAWLPAALRRAGASAPDLDPSGLRASWTADGPGSWSVRLAVRPLGAGGATARLELVTPDPVADPDDDADADDARRLAEIVDRSLADLADEVAENLTAG